MARHRDQPVAMRQFIFSVLMTGFLVPVSGQSQIDSLATTTPVSVDSIPRTPTAPPAGATPVQQAFFLRLSGDADAAMESLEQILTDDPNNPDAIFEAGRTHFYLYQFDLAEADIQRAISLSPQAEKLYELAALLAIYRGLHSMQQIARWPGVFSAFRSGIDYYEQLLTINPDRDDIRVLLIQSYQRLPWILGGSERQAKAHLQLLENGDPFYRTQCAVELIPSDKMADRRALWTDLLNKYPDDARIYEALGKACLRANERQQAITIFGKLAALDSTQYRYLYSLALYHMELKDFPTAREYMDRYLSKIPSELVPLRAHGLMSAARIEHLAGNAEESTRLANAARELDQHVWQTSAPPPEILSRKF